MPLDHWPKGQRKRTLGKYEQGYLAHLILQDRLNARHMEYLFAELDFKRFTRILDIACGAGSRTLAIAREYTHLEAIGLEEHPTLRTYAQAQAEAQGIENICILPLEQPWLANLAPATFDLVNAFAPGSFLRTGEWPAFLRTCWQITRPGGYLRITEAEWGLTSSLALEHLGQLCRQGLHKMGKNYSFDNRYPESVPLLASLLAQAGWEELKYSASVSDFLMGDDLPADPALRRAILEHQWEPLIVTQGIAARDDFEKLMNNAEKEMDREDFCGMQFTLSVLGRRKGQEY